MGTFLGFRPYATFSKTVMWGHRAHVWGTSAVFLACVGKFVTSLPSKYILPCVGSSRPAIKWSKVVLPQSDGLNTANSSPSLIPQIDVLDHIYVSISLGQPPQGD